MLAAGGTGGAAGGAAALEKKKKKKKKSTPKILLPGQTLPGVLAQSAAASAGGGGSGGGSSGGGAGVKKSEKKKGKNGAAEGKKSESKEKAAAENPFQILEGGDAGGDLDESVDNDSNNNNNSCSEEDYSDDNDEGDDGYKIGGYHRVNLGDKFSTRYTVVEKLGWGHFSTVWMVHDKRAAKNSNLEFVALKVQKSAQHYREAAFDEIELLTCASNAAKSESVLAEFGPNYDPCVVLLLDHFEHTGPNGRHVCMVFEMLGENLLKVIKKYDYRGVPISLVKAFTRQICVGLDFLHRQCSIIHTDLKPENILIATPPKPPSQEVVRSFVEGKFNKSGGGGKSGGASSSSGGKKQKQTSGAESGTGAAAIEALTKQLEGEKALTAEQRKKLKKKLKKKRQQAKKKEKRRGGRRKVGDRNDKAGGSSLSADKIANVEMMLMERDSIPSHYRESEAAAAAAAVETAPGKEKQNLQQNKSEAKGGNSSSYELEKSFAALRLTESKQESKYDDAEDRVARKKWEDDFSLDLQDVPIMSSEELSLVMPPWLRPTLFSYLNFSGVSMESEEDPVPLIYGRAAPISGDRWTNPPDASYAKLAMFVSTKKICEAFGEPDEFDSREDDYALADWFFTLQRLKQGRSSTKHDLDLADEDIAGEIDHSLQFAIRGHGVDEKNIMTLAGMCLLNAIAYQPDKFCISSPSDREDKPVLWNIIHHSSMTQHLIAYLERRIEGLRFFTHYDIPHAINEEDDSEILFVMRQLCSHPSCRSIEEDVDRLAHAGKSKVAESKSEFARRTTFDQGLGALLGIDVDALSHSVTVIDTAREDSSTGDYDITVYVRPLESRMRIFSGNSIAIDDAVTEFSSITKTLTFVAGEVSQDGSVDDAEDYEGEQEYADLSKERSSPRFDRLGEEYADARIKIVDLGNACWTFKHFTDDIQTRQYRSPEVILGAPYGTSADMWSLACIVFELITGDLLYDPRAGKTWDREEDHLAMMIELLGNFPKNVTSVGKNTSEYFNKRGELKHIHHLKFWSLEMVLRDKYKLHEDEARQVADFLGPLLEVDPAKRATALECLRHPWLTQKSSNVGLEEEEEEEEVDEG